MCINGRRCVYCSECNVVSNESDESSPTLCNYSVRSVVNLCTLGVPGVLNCDDICMCVVNKQFELFLIAFMLTC